MAKKKEEKKKESGDVKILKKAAVLLLEQIGSLLESNRKKDEIIELYKQIDANNKKIQRIQQDIIDSQKRMLDGMGVEEKEVVEETKDNAN